LSFPNDSLHPLAKAFESPLRHEYPNYTHRSAFKVPYVVLTRVEHSGRSSLGFQVAKGGVNENDLWFIEIDYKRGVLAHF